MPDMAKFLSDATRAIKCDQCSAVVGLYHIPESCRWRCPACIWAEVVRLRAELKQFKEAYRDALGCEPAKE